MKKLLMILVTAALAMTATTGCDIDADLEGGRMIVIDNIFVDPEDWHVYRVDEGFDHFYVDIELPELNRHIFDRGAFFTYRRYDDNEISVQEPDGVTKTYERYEEGRYIAYTETISCSYSVGNLRIEIRRSDFYSRPPTETYWFRTVIYY